MGFLWSCAASSWGLLLSGDADWLSKSVSFSIGVLAVDRRESYSSSSEPSRAYTSVVYDMAGVRVHVGDDGCMDRSVERKPKGLRTIETRTDHRENYRRMKPQKVEEKC